LRVQPLLVGRSAESRRRPLESESAGNVRFRAHRQNVSWPRHDTDV